jgi:hypothetical protein
MALVAIVVAPRLNQEPSGTASDPSRSAVAETPGGSTSQTAEPIASRTAEPTDAPESTTPTVATTFKDITLKGKGTKVVKFDIPEEAAAIAVISHKGRSNFIVHSIDASGQLVDGLVNEIGNYRGTVPFDTDAGEHSVAFEIDADGAWTITVKPLSRAPVWDPATELKGTGDSVYLVSPPSSGLVILNMTFKGDGNFIVHAYTADGLEGLANEIDDFSGQVLLPDGTLLLEVVAHGGTWTMKPG